MMGQHTIDSGERSPLINTFTAKPKLGSYVPRKLIVLTWIAFIVACVEKLVNGSLIAFNIYATDYKELFNYTQTDIELIVSGATIGQGLAIIPGLVYDRFGPRTTSISGLILTTIFILLVWSTTQMVEFYKDKAFLVALYYFGAGNTMMFCYVSSQITCIANLNPNWRGAILGAHVSAYATSFTVYSQIYSNVFVQQDEYGKHSDISGYLLTLLACFIVIDILCVIFCVYYDTWAPTADETPLIIENGHANHDAGHNQQSTAERSGTSGRRSKDKNISVWTMVRTRIFHVFLWPYVFLVAASIAAFNNATIATKALGISDADGALFVGLTVGGIVSGVFGGYLADKLRTRRIFILVSIGLISILSYFMYAFAGEYSSVFVIATTLTSFVTGTLFAATATEVSERFGIHSFGRNWGIMRVVHCVFNFLVQYLFGLIYEKNIAAEGSIDCYGIACVRGGYLLFAGFAILSTISSTIEMVIQIRNGPRK